MHRSLALASVRSVPLRACRHDCPDFHSGDGTKLQCVGIVLLVYCGALLLCVYSPSWHTTRRKRWQVVLRGMSISLNIPRTITFTMGLDHVYVHEHSRVCKLVIIVMALSSKLTWQIFLQYLSSKACRGSAQEQIFRFVIYSRLVCGAYGICWKQASMYPE
jgi:threonine/homoserine/homoserine lactone efflux protein